MLIGWDFNNNGDYPPHDTADTAVINGAGKGTFMDVGGTARSYKELAHFTLKDYGRDDLGGPSGATTIFEQSGGDGSSSEVYYHDIEDINGFRGNSFSDVQGGADIHWSLWNTSWSYLAFENILCQDCSGYMFRGSSDSVSPGYGPLRFKNIGWRALGGTSASGGGAIGAKVWGPGSGYEWVDNKWDMNLANWTPADPDHFAHGIEMAQCTQGIDVINNEFIDIGDRSIEMHGDGGNSFCQSRPIDNVNILQNLFRNSRALPSNSCCTTFIKLQGAESGSPSTVYVNNVTIADNFFSTTQSGDQGMTGAILSAAARNGATIPGTIKIVNNTIHGSYQANRGCGCFRGSIVTDNEDGNGVPANNYVIMDNVISGMDGTSPSRALNIQTASSNLLADNNTYDPHATFIWNGGSEMNFATWRTNLGGCPGTDKDCNSMGSCVPSYVNAAGGDLHLNASDTCARGHGANLSSMPLLSGLTMLDIDRVSRPLGLAWDVGADQAGPAVVLAAPRLLEVVPLP